jgi:ATP-binding protein involved in chromosome partitioning
MGDQNESVREQKEQRQNESFFKALEKLVSVVVASCTESENCNSVTRRAEQSANFDTSAANHFRVAIPLTEGILTNHFGRCEQFALLDISNGRVGRKELITPPPHDPGALPRWIGEQQVNLVIAGGMGQKALELFEERNIRVITGAPNLSPEELIEHYIAGKLETGENVFSH